MEFHQRHGAFCIIEKEQFIPRYGGLYAAAGTDRFIQGDMLGFPCFQVVVCEQTVPTAFAVRLMKQTEGPVIKHRFVNGIQFIDGQRFQRDARFLQVKLVAVAGTAVLPQHHAGKTGGTVASIPDVDDKAFHLVVPAGIFLTPGFSVVGGGHFCQCADLLGVWILLIGIQNQGSVVQQGGASGNFPSPQIQLALHPAPHLGFAGGGRRGAAGNFCHFAATGR